MPKKGKEQEKPEMFENRLVTYKYVQDFLNKRISKDSKYCLDDKSYNIGDFLHLKERIGTDSKFGVIYKTISDDDPKIDIITKLMLANKANTNEVRVNFFVTTLVEQCLSKHFLMTYHVFPECIPSQPNELPIIIKKKKYMIVLNEPADGDLKMLLCQQEFLLDTELLFNVYVQCILSIATLHSYGIIHNDCHYGNFLFTDDKLQEAQEKYYHYHIYGQDYYLKVCRYNMMIYDFGLVRKNDNDIFSQNLAIEDYRRIIPFFMLKEDKSHIDDKEGVIDGYLSKNISLLSKRLDNKLFRDHYANLEAKSETSVISDILDQFVSFTQNVFHKTITENAEIVGSFNISLENIKKMKTPRLLKI